MQDIELYATILGLTGPWEVSGVEMDVKEREVEVTVRCTAKKWACPECHRQMVIKDYVARRWRHLDSCQFKTYIACDVPRVECETHGSQMVQVPWAEPRTGFTLLFERFAIQVMLKTSQRATADALGITWDEAEGIKDRAVRRGLARKPKTPPRRVCFDEKAVGRGHQYATVVVRVDEGKPYVDYIAPTREQRAANRYWRQWSRTDLEAVECVGMDMWKPYADAVRRHVPGGAAKITFDGFHLVKRLNAAVDQVRREEHADLTIKDDTTLKGTRQLWLYGFENLPRRCRSAFKKLLAANLKTGKAWGIKETFRDWFDCRSVDEARIFFRDWYRAAVRSRLEPIVKFARSCKEHLANILTHFVHNLSNAYAENMNSAIAALVSKAHGYRSFERLKRDLLFHHGGLQLYPESAYADSFTP